VARELLHRLDGDPALVDAGCGEIGAARNVYFIGCGTSYHACLAGAVYTAQLAGKAVIPVMAPQFAPQYGNAVSAEDVGIFVSQSGETKDVLNALEAAQARGMTCFSMANVIGSTLTRKTEAWLPLVCGYEISVPATKTFTNQVIASCTWLPNWAGLRTWILPAYRI
jgi:glutamine---fructose-6-phosphate transaminase (isomerizing)